MGYDDVIPLLGDFGKYQRRIYFLLGLPTILCAFHKLGNVFMIAEPKYRCQLPFEESNASYSLNTTQWDQWYPYNHSKDIPVALCTMKNSTPCTSLIFDHETYGYTAVIEFNLTCDKAYLIAVGNSLFMFGVMFGSIVFGEMSDRWGRKKTFFLALVIQVVFGSIAAFAPEFWSFTIARVIVGATTSGVFLVSYVIGMEMVGPSKRMIAGTLCQIFFSFGYMLIVVFALYIPDWRTLQLALTIPGLLFMCYWWVIPESTRWLISKNRLEEAKQNIQKAAECNKVAISDKTLDQLLAPDTNVIEDNEKNHNIFDLFRYPNLRTRSLIIFYDWFANNLTYYGLSWNTNNLGGNPYLNFVISGAVEIPAYIFLIFTLNRWGRKKIMCGCMIIAGTSLLMTMVIPKDIKWLTISLAMFGKMAISASYGAVYIFSSEQFPTVIRNAGLGAGSTFARVGSISAPYVNIASHIWQPLPLLIFGTLTFIGGLLSLKLPETLNRKLPETFQEGENFGRERSDAEHIPEEVDTLKATKSENTSVNPEIKGVESEES